ncbi:MAG: hypothetical protein ACFFAL_09155 [Promethearchaeota archaeon]
MPHLSTHDHISELIKGLKKLDISFVVSEDTLGCQIAEVYIIEALELILLPHHRLDTSQLRWILEIRTPLKVRITFLTSDVKELKIQLVRVITELKQEGLIIPNIEQAISVLELSKENISRLLDSLENWSNLRIKDRPLPSIQTAKPTSCPSPKNPSGFMSKHREDLHVHLRNAIRTYWTERYFARYLNLPIENVKEIAERIGIQREVCGKDTLYFFDREKALGTYFVHIVKGLLSDLGLQYRETAKHDFFLPELQLGLHFFDGEKEQLKIFAGEYANSHDLIVVVSTVLRREIASIQDDFFLVLPLDQDKIKESLIKTLRQRVDYIPAYSSGIINK